MCGCSWERSHTIARANLTAAAASHRCPHPVALVLCLNVGVDPPDLIRTSPCARRECWVEPSSMVAPKAIETIGKTLQAQYEAAVLDMCRVVFAYQWARVKASPATLAKNAPSMGRNSYNKSVDHACWLVRQCDNMLRRREARTAAATKTA